MIVGLGLQKLDGEMALSKTESKNIAMGQIFSSLNHGRASSHDPCIMSWGRAASTLVVTGPSRFIRLLVASRLMRMKLATGC